MFHAALSAWQMLVSCNISLICHLSLSNVVSPELIINIITINWPYCRYLEFCWCSVKISTLVIVCSVSFEESAYCLRTVLLSIVFIYCVSLLLAGNGSIVPEGGSVIGGKCQSNGSLPAETVSLSLRVIHLMTYS